jgi:O-antigen/teichoic acid export membrane protein
LIERFKRYFGYGFWVALETILFIGLPQLVVFPLAAKIVGQEAFGQFVFCLGIVMVIGSAPSMGLFTGIYRELARLEPVRQELLVQTGLGLCKLALGIVVGAGLVAVVLYQIFFKAEPGIAACLIPLLAFLYFLNVFQMHLVRYRVERRFAVRTAWFAILAALQFAGLAGAWLGGTVGLCWGYLAAHAVGYVWLTRQQGISLGRNPFDADLARLLKTVWLYDSVANLLLMSGRNIYRILLGLTHSYSDVSVLFGATSVLNCCMAPLTILSSLLLSMLSGFASLHEVGRRQRRTVLSAGIAIAIAGPIVTYLFAEPLMAMLFPEFAADSAALLKKMVWVLPLEVMISFTKPFVTKFAPIRVIPLLNGVVLLGHLLPSLLLVPRYGLTGVLISYYCGYAIASGCWLAVLVWLFRQRKPEPIPVIETPLKRQD